MSRDTEYRSLRAKVQALLDRDAPRACVLIEVDRHPDREKVVCIAREDVDGYYNVWTIGFIGTEPSSLNSGQYGIALTSASYEMDQRLWR